MILCVWALGQEACFTLNNQSVCEEGMELAAAELGADFVGANCTPTSFLTSTIRPVARPSL